MLKPKELQDHIETLHLSCEWQQLGEILQSEGVRTSDVHSLAYAATCFILAARLDLSKTISIALYNNGDAANPKFLWLHFTVLALRSEPEALEVLKQIKEVSINEPWMLEYEREQADLISTLSKCPASQAHTLKTFHLERNNLNVVQLILGCPRCKSQGTVSQHTALIDAFFPCHICNSPSVATVDSIRTALEGKLLDRDENVSRLTARVKSAPLT